MPGKLGTNSRSDRKGTGKGLDKDAKPVKLGIRLLRQFDLVKQDF